MLKKRFVIMIFNAIKDKISKNIFKIHKNEKKKQKGKTIIFTETVNFLVERLAW